MGRGGAASRTSLSNLDEEHHTPKGGRRHVRLRVKPTWTSVNAL